MRTEWDDLGENNTEDLALSVYLQTSSINASQEFVGKTNSQAPPRPAELEAAFPQHPQGSGLHVQVREALLRGLKPMHPVVIGVLFSFHMLPKA